MMKKITLVALICLLTGLRSFAQTTIVDSLISDGIWRSYRLYIPANYSLGGARPLILNMHGLNSNAYEQQVYSNFMPIADTAGFLMAYPQGLSASGTTYWNVGIPLTLNTDDVKFISLLIDKVSNNYSVNPMRIYATGMSMGGYMSHYLALKLNNRIAAIASVTGSIFSGVYPTANPGRPVPMMQIHGTADSTVPYNGNYLGINIDTLVHFWVNNNRCNPIPIHTVLPDVDVTDQSTVTYDLYTGGANGATCAFYKVEGGEHTWPGASINIGITNRDFNASAEIWRFFRAFQLNQFVGIGSIPETTCTGIYPNPCDQLLHLKTTEQSEITIRNISGQTIQTANGTVIDIHSLPSGTYIVEYRLDKKVVREKLIKR